MSRKPLLRQSLKSGLSACMEGCMLQSNSLVLAGVVGRFSCSLHFSLRLSCDKARRLVVFSPHPFGSYARASWSSV